MTAQEASTALLPLAKQFRALARLEEVLAVVTSFEAEAATRERRLAELTAAVCAAESAAADKIAGAERKQSAELAVIGERLAKARHDAEEELAKLRAGVAASRESAKKLLGQHEAAVAAAQQAAEAVHAELNALVSKRGATEAELAALREKLTTFLG